MDDTDRTGGVDGAKGVSAEGRRADDGVVTGRERTGRPSHEAGTGRKTRPAAGEVVTDGGTAVDETGAETRETDTAAVRATAPAETWDAILEPMETLVAECRVWFGPSGVQFRATDPAQAAMVGVEAGAAAFDDYRASETTVGVNVERLAEAVGLAEGSVTVTLRPETRRLTVAAGGVSYETTVLDPDRVRDAPERAELETGFDYGAEFGVESAAFSRAVRATEMVADYLVVRAHAGDAETGRVERADDADAAGPNDEPTEAVGVVAFEATGDTDECVVRLPADQLEDPALGPAESILSLDYLRLVERALPRETTVTVFAGEETPAAFEYDAGDGVAVEWLVSPRIAR